VYFDTDDNSNMSAEGRMQDMTAAWDVVNKISLTVTKFVGELKELSCPEERRSSKQSRGPSSAPLSPNVPAASDSLNVTRRAVLRECISAGFLAAESF
jgi:hypothetical protein